jgi:hypothetical protein
MGVGGIFERYLDSMLFSRGFRWYRRILICRSDHFWKVLARDALVLDG